MRSEKRYYQLITNSLIMKMNVNFMRNMSIVMLMFFSLISCQKDNNKLNDSPEEKQQFASASSESDADAQSIFDDVSDNVLGVNGEIAIGGTGVFTADGAASTRTLSINDDTVKCYVVTITHINNDHAFPVKVEIDFGVGCTAKDGVTRKGKIIAVYSQRMLLPGAVATTTFDGYYVNGVHVEGTHTLTNTSSMDQLSLQAKITGAKLTYENGNFIEWNSEKTLHMSEGFGTLNPHDDVFQISGSSNGSTQRGDKLFQWSAETTSPLIKKFTCKRIVQGVITYKRNNDKTAVLDYGDGSCDNKATLTVGSWSVEITLR